MKLGKDARDRRMRELHIQRHDASPHAERNREIYEEYRAGLIAGRMSFAALGRKHGISGKRIQAIVRNEEIYDELVKEYGLE
jgi:hypothetical protein